MKIVFITNRFPPDPGGMSRSCARIVNSLRDNGHDLHLVRLGAGNASAPAHASFSQFDTSVDITRAEQSYFHLKDQFTNSIFIGFGGGYPSYLATLWARWSRAKSVSLMRGNDFDRLVHDAKQGWMLHHVLDNADLVGAVSTEMAARIKLMRTKPVSFTPNGIDASAWETFQEDRVKAKNLRDAHNVKKRSVIGIFGQLKSKKGLGVAQDIFKSSRVNSLAALLTVGDVPTLMQKTLSEKLGAANWIKADYCSDNDLPSYYLASDFLLIPSLYDGMPNVMLEAMVMQTAIIASDAGAMPDVLTNGVNALLFKAGDCLDAERAVYQALTMAPDQKSKMIQSAYKRVINDFTPKAEVTALEDAISEHLMTGAAHGL